MPNEFVARNGIIALNNSSITGSLGVSGGITGSLFGTASWALNAVTSSYILNAVSASFASTASFVNPLRQNVIITGSLIITSSAVSTIAGNPTFDGDSVLTIRNNNPVNFPTQVLALDSVRSDTPVDIKLGSSTPKGIRIYADNQVLTSSPAGAGFQFYRITDTNFPGQVYFDSGAHNNAAIIFRTAITSGTITERARIASNGNFLIGTATDAGFKLNVNGTSRFQNNMNVTGSVTATSFTGSLSGSATSATSASFAATASSADNFLVRGTLTAQTIVAQTITSSTDFVTGSTRFGSLSSNTHQFTGSVSITGSLTANGNTTISGSTVITGSFTVITGSAVEFQVTNTGVKIGNIATDTHTVTGSMYQSGSTVALSLRGSGSGVFTVDGTAGRLFSVDDSLSGSLFSVNTAAGLPIIEAFSDNTVRIGQYGQRVLFVSQSRVGIGKETGLNANLDISGSAIISGSLTVFTGSAVELQVTNTGVRIGNVTADVHTVTGSLNVSGSTIIVGNTQITGSVQVSGSTSIFTNTTANSTVTDFVVGGSGNIRFNYLTTGSSARIQISPQGGTIQGQNYSYFTLSAASAKLKLTTDNAANHVEIQPTVGNVAIGKTTTNAKLDISGSAIITGSLTVTSGGLIVSGTLATSGSTSQGLVAPLKFTTATANTNYTLVYTDEGKMVEMNNNTDSPLTVTIPLNSSVSFPIGTEISIIQIGGGTTIITGSSGVTVNSSLGVKTLQNPYDVASVVKRGTDSWYLFGNLS